MDVRGYLDLCGETSIPTGEGGGRVGRRGGGDAIDNRKISCPCRESNSNAHVFPSVRQSINACTGWFPVHTYVGISKNAMPNAGGHGTYQTVWRHKDASLQHRRPHSARDFFPSSPCICICVRIPQCEEFVFIEGVSSTTVTCRPNTTDASTCRHPAHLSGHVLKGIHTSIFFKS